MTISKPNFSTVHCATPGCSRLAIHLCPTLTGASTPRAPSFVISSTTVLSVASSSLDKMIFSPASSTSTLSRIDRAMALGSGFEPCRREDRLRRRRFQILDELAGEVGVGRLGHDPGGVGGRELDLLRKRADELQALPFEQLDLGDGREADLHPFAPQDMLEHLRRADIAHGLRLELLADAEQLEQFLQIRS